MRFVIMKKSFLFLALLVGLAVMTGCKKDQDVVTLKAVISQDTKAYFDPVSHNLPYWDSKDTVNVNGSPYKVNGQGTTFATITGVESSDVYCAIFPDRAVEKMGAPDLNGTKATIYFDPHQMYLTDGNHQRLEMPMGAVTTDDDKTLIFKNLCSILRLKVNNDLGTSFNVGRITIQAFGAYISGSFDVTISQDTVVINTENPNNRTSDNVLSFYAPGNVSMGTITNGNSKTFDIVVPPFKNADYLIFEVEMYNPTSGEILGYSSDTVGNYDDNGTASVSLDPNKIVTLDVDLENYVSPNYSFLAAGPIFNDSIRKLIGDNDMTLIQFQSYPHWLLPSETATNHPGWVEVQDASSPFKIFAQLQGTTVNIYSRAPLYYANRDCSYMFANFPKLGNIQWNTSAEYGFQTEDVTDMSYMFAGDTSFANIGGLNLFNTTNVTNMSHMFDSCINMNGNNLNLSTFNTHNLKDMTAMFKDCKKLQTLNLSSFTTGRVISMKNLFKNCRILRTLHIDQFTISDGTTLTNMFLNLNAGGNNDNKCNIYCTTDGVYTPVHAADANTGIDESLVTWQTITSKK